MRGSKFAAPVLRWTESSLYGGRSMRWLAQLLMTACLAVPGAATAQPVLDPRPVERDSASSGSKIPVTLPGGTEVMEAEGTGSTSTLPPISLETPIDPGTYICGPGDVFDLAFWGRQNFRLRIAADLEGRTFISKIGFVDVAGKSLTDVRALVKNKVRSSYPGLRFELTLASPRSFLVHVVDNIKKPGAYVANPLERVSAVLERAGGVTGSRRRIAIRRTTGARITADLTLYELTGDTVHNPFVLDGDVVTVPVPDVVVTITGPVHRPGTYELVKTKDLAELIELAGGFRTSAARTLPIRLVRRGGKHRPAFHDLPFARSGAPPNRALLDDDVIQVRSTQELQPSVFLIGAVVGADPLDQVATSKRLPYVEGDTVRSLIERAGGIEAPGDLQRSYVSRPQKGKPPLIIPLDLDALLVRRDFTADKPVRMGDTIVVPPMRRSIVVEGAVTRSGVYNYNPRFTVTEYIAQAGGRTRGARDLDEVKLVDTEGTTRSYRAGLRPSPGDAILVPERNFSRAEVVQIFIATAGLVLSGVALTLAATR